MRPAALLDEAGIEADVEASVEAGVDSAVDSAVDSTAVELDAVNPAALLDDEMLGVVAGEVAGTVVVTGTDDAGVSVDRGEDTGVTATEELEVVNPAAELVLATYVVVDKRTGQLVTDSGQLVTVKISVVKTVDSGSEYVGVLIEGVVMV